MIIETQNSKSPLRGYLEGPLRLFSPGEFGELSNGGIFNPGLMATPTGYAGILRVEKNLDTWQGKPYTGACTPWYVELDKNFNLLQHYPLALPAGVGNECRLEDFRVFNFNGRMLVGHVASIRGANNERWNGCQQWLSEVKGNKLVLLAKFPSPQKRNEEKNWGWFVQHETLYFVYSVSPWIVYRVNADKTLAKVLEMPFDTPWSGTGGFISVSAMPVKRPHPTLPKGEGFKSHYPSGKEEYVLWIHRKRNNNYSHTYITFDEQFKPSLVKDAPVLEGGWQQGIQPNGFYISSVAVEGDKQVLFYGEGDSHTHVQILNAAAISDGEWRIANLKSEIPNTQSEIRDPQSAISNQQSRKGIVILALGHPQYGNMAANLASSIRFADKDVNIHLVHNNQSIAHLTPKHKALFTSMAGCPPQYYTKHGKTVYLKAKTCIYELSPFEQTLMLDADMIWCSDNTFKNASSVFNSLTDVPLTFQNRGHCHLLQPNIDEKYSNWCNVREVKEKYNTTGRFYHLHSEFIYFTRSESIQKYFNLVREVFDNPLVKPTTFDGDIPDELAFDVATAVSGIYPHQEDYVPIYWFAMHKGMLDLPKIQREYYGISIGGNNVPAPVLKKYHTLAKFYAKALGLPHSFTVYPKKRWSVGRKNM